jgi:hypothetical protein
MITGLILALPPSRNLDAGEELFGVVVKAIHDKEGGFYITTNTL